MYQLQHDNIHTDIIKKTILILIVTDKIIDGSPFVYIDFKATSAQLVQRINTN